MKRSSAAGRPLVGAAAWLALGFVVLAAGADGGAGRNPTLDAALRRAEAFGNEAVAWYRRTPPIDRVTWGGLGACAVLGLFVMAERTVVLRRGRVVPGGFQKRFRERLQDGKLDRGKAL